MKTALLTFAAVLTLSSASAHAQTRVGLQTSFTGTNEVGINAMFPVYALSDTITLHLSPSLVNHPDTGQDTNVVNEARLDVQVTYDGVRTLQPFAYVGVAGLMLQDSLVVSEEGEPLETEYSDLRYDAEPRLGAGVILGTDCAFQPYLELSSSYSIGFDTQALVGIFYAW